LSQQVRKVDTEHDKSRTSGECTTGKTGESKTGASAGESRTWLSSN